MADHFTKGHTLVLLKYGHGRVDFLFWLGGELLAQEEKYRGVLFLNSEKEAHEMDRQLGAMSAIIQALYQTIELTGNLRSSSVVTALGMGPKT